MNLLFAILLFAPLASDEVCSARLDRLLAAYREYGLPLPPPDAKLVQFVSRSGQVGYDAGRASKDVPPGQTCIGFSLDGRTVLGNFNEPGEVYSIEPAKTDPTTFDKSVNLADLQIAIQCHARGWRKLARAFSRQWHYENASFPEIERDEAYLASFGWAYWINRLSYDSGTPLPIIAYHLNLLLPHLDPDDVDLQASRDLVRALDMALVPRNSRPGSDEALIDKLIDVSGGECTYREIKELRTNPRYQDGFRPDANYQAVLYRGFAAVPALIDHLDDERLTRLVSDRPIINQVFVTEHWRVKNMAWDLLCTLAGEPLADSDADSPTRAEAAREWFAQARKIGEEKYIVARVLGSEDKPFLNEQLFWLVCTKYPKRVPEIYRKLIDDRDSNLAYHSWWFAKAVAMGPLPVAEKRKVLEYAARQAEPHHRAAGVAFLRFFDPEQARDLLTAGLDQLSAHLSDGAMTLAEVAAQRDDPHEWQSLAKAVRGADIGSRLELLKVIAEEPSQANRKLRLAFLAEYMTDDAVRDVNSDPERYKWAFVAGSDFDHLQVRNFAAMRLAIMLEDDATPHANWTAGQWAELREKVRAAVEKELRP
jgi:hypothetical protein